jgi:hypothetical protein
MEGNAIQDGTHTMLPYTKTEIASFIGACLKIA